jgi:hypothetical protein
MRWERLECETGESLQAKTAAGHWVIYHRDFTIGSRVVSDGYVVDWWPLDCATPTQFVLWKTEASAKRAAKRYAKRLAAAFQAFAKAGWQ